ncbi:MAG: hypothetical protein ICV72_11640 [Aldersonia sp.]|nr:hypothetical protein [Aldersonia sp.]
MNYAEGDSIVHPRHGLGTVQGTTTRGSGKRAMTYLEVFFDAKALTIMVPLDSMDEVGVRPPSTKKEADEILSILEQDADVPEAWAERNASTQSRLKSTDITEASRVIRDLTRHSQRSGKPLSQAERAMLDTCMESVSLELSVALKMSQDETKELILSRVGLLEDADAEGGA